MSALNTAPRAFIFDCDGTLLQSMGMWLRAEPALLKTYGIDTVPDDFAEFESLSLMGECEGYHRKWGVGASGEEVYERLMKMVCEGYRTEVTVRPGVVDFLSAARKAGIPMGIATSTPPEAVRIGLEACGLSTYFDTLVTTGEAGASKDHPDVYDLALSKLSASCGLGEVNRKDVWVFEDAVFGLKSSGSVGYRRVGIFDDEGRAQREDVKANCEIFIDSFEELTVDRIFAFED